MAGFEPSTLSQWIRKRSMLSSRFACILGELKVSVLDSIVVSIPACHAGDRGSIPRRGDYFLVVMRKMCS